MLIVRAPAASAARTTSTRNSGSARVASIGLNSTSSVALRARATAYSTIPSTSSRPLRSWCASWTSLEFTNVWMRGASAPRSASAAASTSNGTARASAQTAAPRTSRATAFTARRSAAEAAGKPASITSTRIAASACAISTFCAALKQTPAVCSPSRRVVSNTMTRSETLDMTRSWLPGRGAERVRELPGSRDTKPSPACLGGRGW